MYALLPNEGEGVGSEQIDRIIVGSSKTKKQKKKTSRSEHQKNNVDSGESDVNKDKEETKQSDSTVVGMMKRKGSERSTAVKDSKKSSEASGDRKKPRSLNELLMENMSGSKKNSERQIWCSNGR
ncbi:unnamed protein product [Lactuca saligna]|uniref:Uncharacterized protein n=1 Tax=Lactuca saligna TaxID=75948 RepID=A0AA35V208_LACSI|nr:unnamed protein product [Lactuca saligna]